MKILFITSGYSGIYPYFEKSIEETFLQLNHSFMKITPEYSQDNIAVINSFHPDIALTIVGYKMDKKLLEFLTMKGTALGIWLTEDPFYIDYSFKLAENFHYIFTIDLGAVEFYKEKFPKKNIFHLPLGTDPSLFYPSGTPANYLYDLCLVGFPYPERIELVQYVLDHTPYTMILAGPLWKKYMNKHIRHQRLKIINRWIEPETVRNIFSLSKIILNPHRTFNFHKNKNTHGIESKSINNRTFDIAACGGFQLIPNKPDLTIHFNPSQDIVPYSSFDECIQLINQFVNDEESRNFYSKNARERVLTGHTFSHRVEFILKQIKRV